MDLSGGLQIATVRGIAIRVHWSWTFIFALIAWSLSSAVLPGLVPGWSEQARWIAAFAAAGTFFLSVLLHELSHAIVAQRAGMKVPSIILFIFGGVSNIEGEMESPGREFRIAIAGPAMSFLLGFLFAGLGLVITHEVSRIFVYLGFVNFLLGAFNLLPGFPLDGGRVFRSIIWARTRDFAKATRIATRVGTGIAWMMIALGIYTVFFHSIVGLWYVLIGFFLKSASEAAYGQMVLERTLDGVRIGNVMRPPPATVDGASTLAQIVEDRVLGRGERVVFIEGSGHIAGLLTTTDLARIPREQHASTTAAQAMVPAEQVVTVTPDLPLLQALRTMVERDIHQLPVVEGGRLIGVISRGDVMEQLEARQRFTATRS